MNSQPLFPLADNYHDLHTLMTAQFIVQRSLLSPSRFTQRTLNDQEITTNSRITDSFLDKIQD